MSTTALQLTPSLGDASFRVTRPTGHSKLRLTRRGRLLVSSVVLVIAVLLVAAALRPSGAVAEPAPAAIDTVTVTVLPGDTLWGVAESLGGDADVRDVVEQIRSLNVLEGQSLRAGQTLIVPVVAG